MLYQNLIWQTNRASGVKQQLNTVPALPSTANKQQKDAADLSLDAYHCDCRQRRRDADGNGRFNSTGVDAAKGTAQV